MDLAPDFDEFIGCLIAHGVDFVIVGAYALAFHGAPRFTGGLDVKAKTGEDIADSNSVRVSAGLGISWQSPFGPIRVDYAVPIKQESYDDDERFRFSFGTSF